MDAGRAAIMRAQIYHSGIQTFPEEPVLQSVSAYARSAATSALALVACLLPAAAIGASATVPYVPTPQPIVDRMLEVAKVGRSDYLIDLGSGDGRIVVTAAKKFGTRGF